MNVLNFKLTPTAVATAALLGTLSTAANANLVITEYVEGSSNNKAIEISNMGNSPIDLDANVYVIGLYDNGKTEAKNKETLTGIIQPGESIVYHNSSAAEEFKIGTPSTINYFNGDDALMLTKDGATIDRFGIVGNDPGDPNPGWTDPNNPDFQTAEVTLRRKSTVTIGDTVADAPFPGDDNQWVIFPQNTADGLGCPGEDACSAEPPAPGVLLITEYVESGSDKAVEVSNVGGSDIDLTAGVYKLEKYSNGSTTAGTSEVLDTTLVPSGILAPGDSVVFHKASTAEYQVGKSSEVANFNGDDALVLSLDDTPIDSFGRRGEDPGSGWTDPNVPEFSTEDRTLRRKASVTAGDALPDDEFPGAVNKWVVLDPITHTGLGCAGEEACGEDPGPGPGPDPDPDPNYPDPSKPCDGCVPLTQIQDPASYNGNVYYTDVLNGAQETPVEWKNAVSAAAAKGHTQLSYNEVWSVLTFADQDMTNNKNLIMFYRRDSFPKNNRDQGSGTENWNREHTWPKSHGLEGTWGYTDTHHLRPTNKQVNSIRGSKDFDMGGSPVEGATGNFTDSDSFEPHDEVKGDAARIVFYMDTRYQGGDNTNVGDLTVVDKVGTSGNQLGKLCTLYTWHQQDPVSEEEVRRNSQVYRFQGNRNPYIDYPDWVQEVYGAQCGDAPVPPLDVTITIDAPVDVKEGESLTLSATVTDNPAPAAAASYTYKWERTDVTPVVTIGETASITYQAPMVDDDQVMNFKVTVSDGTASNDKAVSVNVLNTELVGNIVVNGPAEVNEGESVELTAAVSDDYQGEPLTFSWTQVSGDKVEITGDGATISFVAPEVTMNHNMTFEVTASNDMGEITKETVVTVVNVQQPGWQRPESSGAMGGLIGLLLPLLFWRRRQS